MKRLLAVLIVKIGERGNEARNEVTERQLHMNLVQLPRDRKAVGSKWIYKIKIKADGSIERYKAQLVAQGYTQK